MLLLPEGFAFDCTLKYSMKERKHELIGSDAFIFHVIDTYTVIHAAHQSSTVALLDHLEISLQVGLQGYFPRDLQ
jgi:hypothetical protein